MNHCLQTPASGYSGVMDDLVFSGAGSGCNADDEDECAPAFENGSGIPAKHSYSFLPFAPKPKFEQVF